MSGVQYNEADLQNQIMAQLQGQGVPTGSMNPNEIKVSMKGTNQPLTVRNMDGSVVEMDSATQQAIAQQTGSDNINTGTQSGVSQQSTAGKLSSATPSAYNNAQQQQSSAYDNNNNSSSYVNTQSLTPAQSDYNSTGGAPYQQDRDYSNQYNSNANYQNKPSNPTLDKLYNRTTGTDSGMNKQQHSQQQPNSITKINDQYLTENQYRNAQRTDQQQNTGNESNSCQCNIM